jgi:hypothetical protein
MRVLNEVQTDGVGGGLQFVGYTGSNGWDSFYRDYLVGMGGGRITSGNSGSTEPSIYGGHLVDPVACRNDVLVATAAGAALGIVGGAIAGKGVGSALAGGAVVGTLAGLHAFSTSPNCKPK